MPRAKGLIVDPPDAKDFAIDQIKDQLKFKMKAVHGVSAPPAAVDLRPFMSPLRDQGNCGSCGGQSGVAIAESLEILHLRDPFFPLSPLFLYRLGRILDGSDVNADTGATLRSIMKALATTGVCPESLFPYDVAKFAAEPSAEALADTERFRVHSYYRVSTLAEIKLALAARHAVLCGIMVYDSLESDSVAHTGMVPMPDILHETFNGGHGVSLFGYDDHGGVDGSGGVRFKNSWGTTWGDKGTAVLPYEFFEPERGLVSDMWVATV